MTLVSAPVVPSGPRSWSIIHNHRNVEREDSACVCDFSDIDVQNHAMVLANTWVAINQMLSTNRTNGLTCYCGSGYDVAVQEFEEALRGYQHTVHVFYVVVAQSWCGQGILASSIFYYMIFLIQHLFPPQNSEHAHT